MEQEVDDLIEDCLKIANRDEDEEDDVLQNFEVEFLYPL